MKQDDLPEIDESLLTEEQKAEMHSRKISPGWIIFFSVMVVLIVACIVVISVLR